MIDTNGTRFYYIEQGDAVSIVGQYASIKDYDGIDDHKVISHFCASIVDPTPDDELIVIDGIDMSGDDSIEQSSYNHTVCVSMESCSNNFNDVSCFRTQLSSVQYQSTEQEPVSVNRTVTIILTVSLYRGMTLWGSYNEASYVLHQYRLMMEI